MMEPSEEFSEGSLDLCNTPLPVSAATEEEHHVHSSQQAGPRI
jgi:hypothetical protein